MTTSTRPTLSGLLDLVSRFRASGTPGADDRANALEALAKGAEDIEKVIALAKAAGKPDDADPETDSEEGKDDTTQGEEAGLDKGCSGEPMDKGGAEPEVGETAEHEAGETKKEEAAEHGMAKGAGQGTSADDQLSGVVDATDLIKGLDARLDGLLVLCNQIVDDHRAALKRQDAFEARISNMEAMAKGTQEHVGLLGKAVGTLGEHVATGFVALAKANGEAILHAREHAPGVSGTPVNVQRAAERLGGALVATEGARFTTAHLIKGTNQKILTERQVLLYERTGVFDNDASTHDALSAKLRAAITTP